MIALWIVGAIAINVLIGCIIGAAIDDEQQRWLKWMERCPLGFSFAVSCWPVWLCLWWRENRKPPAEPDEHGTHYQ